MFITLEQSMAWRPGGPFESLEALLRSMNDLVCRGLRFGEGYFGDVSEQLPWECELATATATVLDCRGWLEKNLKTYILT